MRQGELESLSGHQSEPAILHGKEASQGGRRSASAGPNNVRPRPIPPLHVLPRTSEYDYLEIGLLQS